MKYSCVIFLVTLLTFVVNTSGWAYGAKFYNPDNPGKCTFTGNVILSPGEKIDHPQKELCATVQCEDDQGSVLVIGCVLKLYIPNCKSGGQVDKNAPYPECCKEHLICNDLVAQTTQESY